MKNLYILPFDHRGSFSKGLFKVEGELSPEIHAKVTEFKKIIYDAFKKSLDIVPQDEAAILVDEEFGDEIIRDAVGSNYQVILTLEKSGQDVFDFEYGDDFAAHIEKYNPPYVKVLMRYNPSTNQEGNAVQRERLKKLSDYSHEHGHKLLLEPLVPATPEQLESVGGDAHRYDTEVRPLETIKMMKELQEAGVEVDIWKLEGFESSHDYEMIVSQAHEGGRDDVGVVVLGRAADQAQVEKWLAAGASVPGVTGFAVGRTIFWQPLEEYRDEKISRDQAVATICENFLHYYNFFLSHRR